MSRIAFIGLGVMGYPMAGHLARAGHQVVVFNRTATRAAAWVDEYGGTSAPTPSAAAQGAEFVFTCVGNDDDVAEVILGDDGVLQFMEAGRTLIDHTTASADLARRLAQQAAQRGVGFVDAPVSGGQKGAETGQLTIMCGSDDPDAYERARSVMITYARACERLGGAGSGQLAKMANQIAIGGVLQGLAEAINFAQRAGLDIDQLVPVISKGAAGSWQMENRSSTMARDEFDFGFAVKWMRKDLGIALDEAERNGARLPVTALVDQFYAQVVDRGGARWDTSSLIHLLHHP
jgi:3-hydroxyisobutyrate dehydrogenase